MLGRPIIAQAIESAAEWIQLQRNSALSRTTQDLALIPVERLPVFRGQHRHLAAVLTSFPGSACSFEARVCARVASYNRLGHPTVMPLDDWSDRAGGVLTQHSHTTAGRLPMGIGAGGVAECMAGQDRPHLLRCPGLRPEGVADAGPAFFHIPGL